MREGGNAPRDTRETYGGVFNGFGGCVWSDLAGFDKNKPEIFVGTGSESPNAISGGIKAPLFRSFSSITLDSHYRVSELDDGEKVGFICCLGRETDQVFVALTVSGGKESKQSTT